MPDVSIAGRRDRGLLADWTEAQHLLILVNAKKTEKAELEKRLTNVKTLAISSSDLDEEGRRLLGSEDKLFVVRPDGYIGFRSLVSDTADLDSYARQDGIQAARETERSAMAR